MPELPEVENIKLGLKPKILNKKIINVEYSNLVCLSHELGIKAIIKDNLEWFDKNISDKNIIDVKRRGKYIYFELDKGYLITHFGMTGAYFVVNSIEEITNKNYYTHSHITFNLSNGEKLIYSDIRRFGGIRYVENLSEFKPFSNLAPEPFEENSLNYFLEKLDNKKYREKKIKPLLLDGNIFCGCGNIYACEVLYKEKIHPELLAKDLSKDKKIKLFNSLTNILEFSIKQGGSTISDFVHSNGEEGNMQNFLVVYGKKVCPKGHKIENTIISSRNTHYCPDCQKF